MITKWPDNELKRSKWQWPSLLLLLFIVLVLGVLVALPSQNSSFALIFAVAGFSIAFAIHYFGVSVGLNTRYIQEEDQKKRCKLREIEYNIVTSGMLVLAGGLLLLFAGGMGMLLQNHRWIFLSFYVIGALLLLLGVARYVFCQRGWPRKAQEVIGKKP